MIASSLASLSFAGGLVALSAKIFVGRPGIWSFGVIGWVATTLAVVASLYFAQSALRSRGIVLSAGSLRADASLLDRSVAWEAIATVTVRRRAFGGSWLSIRLTDAAMRALPRASRWYQRISGRGRRGLLVDTTALACRPEALASVIEFYRAYPAMREEIGTGADLERLRHAQLGGPQAG